MLIEHFCQLSTVQIPNSNYLVPAGADEFVRFLVHSQTVHRSVRCGVLQIVHTFAAVNVPYLDYAVGTAANYTIWAERLQTHDEARVAFENSQTHATFDIPYDDAFVFGSAGYSTLTDERDALDTVQVSLERFQASTLVQAPYFNGGVGACAHDFRLVAAQHGQAIDPLGVSVHGLQTFAAFDVPYFDGRIEAAANDASFVEQFEAIGIQVSPLERSRTLARVDVPNFDFTVGACAHERVGAAVWHQLDREYVARVAVESSNTLAAF